MLTSKWILPIILVTSTGLAELTFNPEVRVDTHPDGTTGGVDVIRLNNGRFVVVWDGENSAQETFKVWSSFSDDSGATWSFSIPIGDEDALGSQFPKIAVDSLNILYTVWDDWRGPEAFAPYFSRSDNDGETWLWPNVKISDDGFSSGNASIAANTDGSRLVAVFTRLDGLRVYSSFSTDGGTTWSPDVPVGDYTTAGQYYPVIANTGDSSFTALWKDERDTVSYVYCSVSGDGGETWLTSNIPVPWGGHDVRSQSIDLYSDGSVLHAFWIEEYTILDTWVNEVYYTRSSDGGYTWLDEPVRIDEGSLNTQRQRGGIWARDPANIYAVWCSMFDLSYPIYAVCAVSSDSGKTWSDTLRANPISGEAFRCNIFGDKDTGSILVAWSNQINQHIMSSWGSDDSGIEVEDEVSDSGLLVSRNPFSGAVIFTVGGEVTPEELSVYDSAGRMVASLKHSENRSFTWAPSENDPPGVYFVRGIAEDEHLCVKVIRL